MACASTDDGPLLTGLDLVEPGVVPIVHWRPDQDERLSDAQAALYGGVARKP